MLTITAKIKLELYIYNLKNQGIYMGEINSLRQGTGDKLLLYQRSTGIITKLSLRWFADESPETHFGGQQSFLVNKSGDKRVL